MSKIRELLEELAERAMIRVRDENSNVDLERDTADTLSIITCALVDLGVNDGAESKVSKKYIELTTSDWEGKTEIVKVKEEAIMSYQPMNQNGVDGLNVHCINMSYFVKMTAEEFEKFVYGKGE